MTDSQKEQPNGMRAISEGVGLRLPRDRGMRNGRASRRLHPAVYMAQVQAPSACIFDA